MNIEDQTKQFAADIAEKIRAIERKFGIYTGLAEAVRQMIIHKLTKEGWTKIK